MVLPGQLGGRVGRCRLSYSKPLQDDTSRRGSSFGAYVHKGLAPHRGNRPRLISPVVMARSESSKRRRNPLVFCRGATCCALFCPRVLLEFLRGLPHRACRHSSQWQRLGNTALERSTKQPVFLNAQRVRRWLRPTLRCYALTPFCIKNPFFNSST